jgi:hypothetical protein
MHNPINPCQWLNFYAQTINLKNENYEPIKEFYTTRQKN